MKNVCYLNKKSVHIWHPSTLQLNNFNYLCVAKTKHRHRKSLRVVTSVDFVWLLLSFFIGIHCMNLCPACSIIFILGLEDLQLDHHAKTLWRQLPGWKSYNHCHHNQDGKLLFYFFNPHATECTGSQNSRFTYTISEIILKISSV